MPNNLIDVGADDNTRHAFSKKDTNGDYQTYHGTPITDRDVRKSRRDLVLHPTQHVAEAKYDELAHVDAPQMSEAPVADVAPQVAE